MSDMSSRVAGAALLVGAAVGLTALYWTMPLVSYRGSTTRWYPPLHWTGGPAYSPMVGSGPAMGHGWSRPGGPPARAYVNRPTTEMDDAVRAFEEYVSTYLGDGYALREVMEFQNNFYAVVVERDTGMGALELLLWKDGGRIAPEPGPNMMWNLKYGMRPAYAREYSASVGPERASEIAVGALGEAFPGVEVEVGEPIPFYGYYTMDYKLDGEMYGMLSVNSLTGEAWFHTWHGGFVREVELGPGEGEH